MKANIYMYSTCYPNLARGTPFGAFQNDENWKKLSPGSVSEVLEPNFDSTFGLTRNPELKKLLCV